MRLLVQGYCHRTSGPSDPFEERELIFENLSSWMWKEVALPWPDCSFVFEGIDDQSVYLNFQNNRLGVNKGETKRLHLERNTLGIEITFTLTE